MNKLKEEFKKFITVHKMIDGFKCNPEWNCEPEVIWNWITQNYISKEEILGLIYSDIKDLPKLLELKEKVINLKAK